MGIEAAWVRARLRELGLPAALLLACALAGVLAVAGAIGWLDRPFPGFLLARDGSVHALGLRHWPGARAGMDSSWWVAALDGRPVAGGQEAYGRLAERRTPGPARWRFRTPAGERELALPVRPLGLADWLLVFGPPCLAGWLVLGMASWTLWAGGAQPQARVYVLLSALASLAVFGAFDSATDYALADLWAAAIGLAAAPLLHLGLIFPASHPWLRRHPWLALAPYALAGVLLGLAALLHAWLYSPPLARQLFYWKIVAPSLATLALVALLWRARQAAGSLLLRRQAGVVGLGIAAGLGVPAAWAIAFWLGWPFGELSVVLACTALFPVSIGYAVTRHRLFGIREAASRLTVYAGLTAVLAAAYFVSVALLAPALQARWPLLGAHWLLPSLLMAAVGFGLRPWHRALQGAVDRAFFPGRFERERRVATFFQDLQPGLSLTELTRELETLVGSLFGADCRLLPAGPRDPRAPAASKSPPAWGALRMPLVVEQCLVGQLELGPRWDGDSYRREEQDLLALLATSAAIAVERARYAAQAVDLAVRHEAARVHALYMEELTARVRHDLKLPLQLIRRVAADIQDEWPGDVAAGRPERIQRGLERITATALRLERSVQQALDRSALQAGALRLSLAPMDAAARARRLVEEYEPVWRSQGLAVEVDLPPYLPAVLADGERLAHVLENLLSNAIKYTPPAGRIAVRGRTDGRQLYLHVRDSGQGIPPADHEQVFRPFARAGGGVPEGTGLGLAICRDYIQLMRGRLRLDSAPGRGTTFTVVLPLAPPAEDHDRLVTGRRAA